MYTISLYIMVDSEIHNLFAPFLVFQYWYLISLDKPLLSHALEPLSGQKYKIFYVASEEII